MKFDQAKYTEDFYGHHDQITEVIAMLIEMLSAEIEADELRARISSYQGGRLDINEYLVS